MNIKPLDDRVVLQRLEPEQTSSGGIVIPDTAAEKMTQGTVITVGPGKVLKSGDVITPALKVGERVLFDKFAGTEVEVGGELLLILRESDVLGVLDV